MRLFVAVWPTSVAIDALRALARPPDDGVRWTTEDQWHVTLRFLGEVDDVAAGEVGDALAEAARAERACVARMGPTTVAVGSMVWAPVEGLDALGAAVVGATRGMGVPPEDRPFRGHVTLARARARHRGATRLVRSLAGAPISVEWPVGSFDLVRSELRPGGARYAALASFSLPS